MQAVVLKITVYLPAGTFKPRAAIKLDDLNIRFKLSVKQLLKNVNNNDMKVDSCL